jgi:hypothetical protein
MTENDNWVCPNCGRRFARPNTQHTCSRHTVQGHLDQATPHALALFDGLRKLAAECGEFFEEATKSAISFKTPRLFIAVGLRKQSINCTIWLPEPIRHPRIRKNYPVSNLYAVQMSIKSLEELDGQLKNWLCRAYFYLESAG